MRRVKLRDVEFLSKTTQLTLAELLVEAVFDLSFACKKNLRLSSAQLVGFSAHPSLVAVTARLTCIPPAQLLAAPACEAFLLSFLLSQLEFKNGGGEASVAGMKMYLGW